MTVAKCIAVVLIDTLVMLFTGMLLFHDNGDIATIFPVWYILTMIVVAVGSAYIVARSDIKRKKKPEIVDAEIVYVPGKQELKETPDQSLAINEPEATVQDAFPEKVITASIPAESTSAHIDIEKIISDEEEWRRQQRGLSPVEDELRKVDFMEGHDFEKWCAQLLLKRGFESAEVTPGSNDQGVDIVAVKDGIKYAIQCKCYASDLGNTPIQEVNTGKMIYRCHVGVVMTNRHFTSGAIEAATATGTLLWSRNELERWIGETLGVRNLPSSVVPDKVETVQQGNDYDPLLKQAVDVILETNQASVSMIQRRLKLGYSRSACIIDQLEELHIVGEYRGSMPRKILVKENPLK